MEGIGQVNCYGCKSCNRMFGTVNLNSGVTPFIVRCRLCDEGMAQSSFYRLPNKLNVRHGWYRPKREEFGKLEPEMREHILNGGLLLKPLGEADPLDDENLHRQKLWSDFLSGVYDLSQSQETWLRKKCREVAQ